MRIFAITLIILIFNIPAIYASGVFPLDDPSKILIGFNQIHIIKDEETLIELAREYDVGYNEIIAANRNIDPWIPEKGTKVLIPTSWLLPEILEEGLLINLAEMRLYYFFTINKKKYVRTYPIGIGREGFNTPVGSFRIISKERDPVWNIPENIRKEYPELPPFIPPGPDNPLGKYWLQLSVNGYGLHGTNKPYGIGRRVSHGCIRLYPEDIEILFSSIKSGTKVKIIDEPVKVGIYNDKVYIEVHSSGREESELIMLAVKKLSRKRLLKHVETRLLFNAIKKATGLPTIVSTSK